MGSENEAKGLEVKLSEIFEVGWKHFCTCIVWSASNLDAEAIRFMNEVPGQVLKALKNAEQKGKELKK